MINTEPGARCMRAFVFAPLILLALLVAGCSVFGSEDDAEDLIFATDQASYRAGDEVMLRLMNRTDSDIEYNLCGSQLQRLSNTTWIRIERDIACILIVRLLEPGDETTYAYRLPERLSNPGLYRMETTISIRAENGDTRAHTLRTRSFRIDSAM